MNCFCVKLWKMKNSASLWFVEAWQLYAHSVSKDIRGTTYSPTASISRWSVIFRQAWAQAVLATHWASNSEIRSTTCGSPRKKNATIALWRKPLLINVGHIWVWYIPINTIFRGMNIHLPAILMFTRGTIGFDTLPYDPKIPMDTNPKRTGVALVSISNPVSWKVAWNAKKNISGASRNFTVASFHERFLQRETGQINWTPDIIWVW